MKSELLYSSSEDVDDVGSNDGNSDGSGPFEERSLDAELENFLGGGEIYISLVQIRHEGQRC